MDRESSCRMLLVDKSRAESLTMKRDDGISGRVEVKRIGLQGHAGSTGRACVGQPMMASRFRGVG